MPLPSLQRPSWLCKDFSSHSFYPCIDHRGYKRLFLHPPAMLTMTIVVTRCCFFIHLPPFQKPSLLCEVYEVFSLFSLHLAKTVYGAVSSFSFHLCKDHRGYTRHFLHAPTMLTKTTVVMRGLFLTLPPSLQRSSRRGYKKPFLLYFFS